MHHSTILVRYCWIGTALEQRGGTSKIVWVRVRRWNMIHHIILVQYCTQVFDRPSHLRWWSPLYRKSKRSSPYHRLTTAHQSQMCCRNRRIFFLVLLTDSNDSALLASLNVLGKSQSSNHSRTSLAHPEPFLIISDHPG